MHHFPAEMQEDDGNLMDEMLSLIYHIFFNDSVFLDCLCISQATLFVFAFIEQAPLYLWPLATLGTASVTEKTLLTLAQRII